MIGNVIHRRSERLEPIDTHALQKQLLDDLSVRSGRRFQRHAPGLEDHSVNTTPVTGLGRLAFDEATIFEAEHRLRYQCS